MPVPGHQRAAWGGGGSTPPAPTHYWRVRKTLPERFGQSCAIFARASGPGPRSIGVLFGDGVRVVTHRHAVRRLHIDGESGKTGE
ncbi:MAG TPA: hypothetical protein VEQ85_08925 [Lacipirellulaceae bacterium]|nr:hypothetical protein [Lacipirellulaceae bacterium]